MWERAIICLSVWCQIISGGKVLLAGHQFKSHLYELLQVGADKNLHV